jgi:hypothetical protein
MKAKGSCLMFLLALLAACDDRKAGLPGGDTPEGMVAQTIHVTTDPNPPANADGKVVHVVLTGPLERPSKFDLILGASGDERKKLLKECEEAESDFRSVPEELEFGCVRSIYGNEDGWNELMQKGDPATRLVAAKVLWQNHSRKYAQAVQVFLAEATPKDQGFQAVDEYVEKSLTAKEIQRELVEGDYEWGAWLACLRPHKDLVPTLLEALTNKSDFYPETILALGKSGDKRALEPLLCLMKGDDYRTAGDAAQALGYLGLPETEPELIDALSPDNGWRQVMACSALAKIGTRRALPALERLAKDDRYTGALNIRGAARAAVESIAKREKE